MPGLQLHQKGENASASVHCNPEDTPLSLPSSLPPDRISVVCYPGLPSIEEKLRTAQCYDALEGLRHILRLKTRMVNFKNKNSRGQREGLRSHAIIDRVHARARKTTEKYRAARAAKLKLSGPGEWEKVLRLLHDADVRSYSDPDRLRPKQGRLGTMEEVEGGNVDEAGATGGKIQAPVPEEDGRGINLLPEERSKRDGTGETRRTLSWIWVVENRSAGIAAENDEGLRADWAKSRSRAARTTEEVLLLREEMRRVLAFLQWKAQWWTAKQESRKAADKALAEGLKAYSLEQAGLQVLLSTHFQTIWKQPLEGSGGAEGEKLHDDDDPDDGDGEEEELADTDESDDD